MKYKFTTTALLIFFVAVSFNLLAQTSDPVLLFYNNGENFRKKADKARAEAEQLRNNNKDKTRAEEQFEVANKNYYEAIFAYDHAIAISDTSAQIFNRKGYCFYMLQGVDNSLSNAVSALEASLERDPKFMNSYELMLAIYKRTENTTMIVEILDRMADAIEDDKLKFKYHLDILKILLDKRSYKHAKPHVADALEIAPGNLDIIDYKVQIHNGLGEYNEAVATLSPLVGKLSGNDLNQNARFYYQLGYAYHHLGDYKKAQDVFARGDYGKYRNLISKLKPDHFYMVAYGYSKIYEYETAQDMLQQALKIDPGFPKAYDLLADIAIKTEHHYKGIEYYEKAVEGLADQDEYLLNIYADKLLPTLINAKQFSEAVIIADKALGIFPSNTQIKYLKAIALHHQNKNQDAIAIMNSIMCEAPSSPIQENLHHFALGMMHVAVNDIEKAKQSFERATRGPYSNASQHAYDILIEQEARQSNN